MMTDAQVAALLADQIDVRGKSAGMVAGIVSPEDRRVVAHGVTARNGSVAVDGGTAFELASLSKVFTGLVLADMVRRGEVGLTDPVARYLPHGMTAPSWRGREITLHDLATHTSGLPAWPPDAPTLDDPRLEAYSIDQLFLALSTFRLTRPIGTFEYGNWDLAVLAQVLALRAGTSFDALVEQRVTRPLGMANTAVERTASMRLSSSHSADLTVIPRLRLGSLAPAGGFVSTADDLLTLASALLGLTPSPLAGLLDVIAAGRRPIRPQFGRMLKDNWRLMLRMIVAPPKDARRPVRYFTSGDASLGWFVWSKGKREMFVHDGGAPSGSSSLAIDRHAGTAVVVLSNTGVNIYDVSRHLLWSDYPLCRTRTEVRVAPAVLDRYVGTYQAGNFPPFGIRRSGDGRLTITFPVMGDLILRAENDYEFFLPEMDIEFKFAADGPITEMLMRPMRALPMVPVPKVD
jgi:serine-type D-Ala-D-Ala carboxypeptidase/endopeptidase